MKRARDENGTSETNEKGVDKTASENGRERDALGSTSDITSSREEEEAELRRKLLEKIRANREDAGGGKPTSESSKAESPPPKARKTEGEEGAASLSAGVPSERLKGEGMGDGDPLPEVEGVPNETLFVGNLSYRVSEAVIIKLFTPYGKVVREQFCYHMAGPRRGEPRGFCFVEYSNIEEAKKAIRALHGRKLYGRPLRVRFMTVEGAGRMDYSNSDNGKGLLSSAGPASAAASSGESAAGKIPPPSSASGEAGVGAGVTKLSLDKKVALLKLKLREAGKPGT